MSELLQVPVDDYTFKLFRQQAQAAGLSVADYLRSLAEQQGKRRFVDTYPAELSPEEEKELDARLTRLREEQAAGSTRPGAVGVHSVAEMKRLFESGADNI